MIFYLIIGTLVVFIGIGIWLTIMSVGSGGNKK